MTVVALPPVAPVAPPKRPKTKMQKVIEEIVAFNGLTEAFEKAADLEHSFHLKLEQPNYMPFVIERHGRRIMVCHYFLQEGDVMYDPEIVVLPASSTSLCGLENLYIRSCFLAKVWYLQPSPLVPPLG